MSWLPQRPVLVPGTVDDNLRLFGELDDIETACAIAGFDTVLAELPDAGATPLGRGGERQRLGRALGSRAAVLLLDEPTAHLDAGTEERVLRAVVERARAGAIGDRVVAVSADRGARCAAA